MVKQLYIVRGTGPVAEFAQWFHRDVTPQLPAATPGPLKFALTEEAPPWLTIVPFRRTPLALVTLGAGGDEGGRVRALLSPLGAVHAYRASVTEPVPYAPTWPLGAATPSALLLTMFRKRADLSRERFFAIWHGEHTPLALRIHPLVGYVRSAVEGPLDQGTPHFDGIVEEHFRSRGELLSPLRMFGAQGNPLRNMVEVALHVRTFIDFGSIENYLLREYVLRA